MTVSTRVEKNFKIMLLRGVPPKKNDQNHESVFPILETDYMRFFDFLKITSPPLFLSVKMTFLSKTSVIWGKRSFLKLTKKLKSKGGQNVKNRMTILTHVSECFYTF